METMDEIKERDSKGCRIILFDIDSNIVEAWRKEFDGVEGVQILHAPFEEIESEYVVTAGNSFGWMTGGIDLAVRNYYGVEVQDAIQQQIIFYYRGEMPVGKALVVKTRDEKKPNLIYMPTMRYPGKIEPIDVFYVFYKLLDNFKEKEIACCGLGTLTGGVSAEDCAKAMRKAYREVYGK